MKEILVLGVTGCKRCEELADTIRKVAEEGGIVARVEKVADPKALLEYMVLTTPGVVVDGKLVHTGSVPDQKMISAWLSA